MGRISQTQETAPSPDHLLQDLRMSRVPGKKSCAHKPISRFPPEFWNDLEVDLVQRLKHEHRVSLPKKQEDGYASELTLAHQLI